MKVPREFVVGQVKRLMGKPFPPDTPETMGEVIATIQRTAEDESHVVRIVDHVLGVAGAFPEPAAFDVASEVTSSSTIAADPLCARCGGCGFVSTRRGGTEVEHRCLCPTSPCEICEGTRTFTVVRGGWLFSEKCNCWARRPKGLRPWGAKEGASV